MKMSDDDFESTPKGDTTQVSVRLSNKLIAKIDNVAAKRRAVDKGLLKVTRADVIRALIVRGLDKEEK